jgi:RimJ/RimL family protein N-acetyltransferase
VTTDLSPEAAGPTRVTTGALVTTARLTLRPHRESDLERLVSIYSQPEVARHLLEEPWTLDSGAAHLQRRLARTGLDEPGGALALAIEHGGTLIGAVSVWRTEQERRTVEVGWTLDPAHGGNGYATEAVAAVLRFAFERHDVHRAVAQMDARNDSSARLAGRLGMRQEAHFRSDFWSKGEWTDTLVFAMLRSELRVV